METGLTIFRIFLGVVSVVIMALLMWGLKSGMTFMGRDFALGVGCGVGGLMLLLWLHWKVTGINIFTEDQDASSR